MYNVTNNYHQLQKTTILPKRLYSRGVSLFLFLFHRQSEDRSAVVLEKYSASGNDRGGFAWLRLLFLEAFFLTLVFGSAWAQTISDGYYVIENARYTTYYLHPTTSDDGSVLKIDQGYLADRIWKMTNASGSLYYMQNYATGYYINHTSGTGAGCVTMSNTTSPGTANRFKVVEYSTDIYAIIPYNYRNSGSGSNISFNPYAGVNGNIGLYRYNNDAGSRWNFHPVTFGITNAISGQAAIAIDGTYAYTAPTTLDVYLDGSTTSSFSVDDETFTYSWSYNSLPSGVTASISDNTLTLACSSFESGSVTLTCEVTNTTANTTITITKTVQFTAPQYISSLSELQSLASTGTYYILAADIDASSLTASISGFTGVLDGQFHQITGLTKPLFDQLSNATVKNLILDNVQLSGTITVNSIDCLGAIAAYADGSTKIYNCGILSKEGTSSVSGGNYTGSLVGYITGNTRVVNNYSYANVTGEAGIVGHVAGTALTNDNHSGNNHCAVTNNMFYGNLTSGTSPVYGGNHTSNIQDVNEYNFWRSKASVSYTAYNNQLAIDKDSYLNRFPFYRHIQNTHRELAAIYLFGELTDDNVAEIGHWYNVKNDTMILYPVLEEWQTNTHRTTVDIAANLPSTTEKYAGKLLSDISADGYYTGSGEQVTTMGTNGYLTVYVSINGSSYTSQLPITDMDTLNYDFTWGKVVLPFANEYDGWTRDYSKICTGWKITSITGGTTGTFENYNFADRDCTAKDLYSNSNYIYAQGGNYIVPYGVTAINIEANFANAFYLSDAYYDFGYDIDYANATGLITTVPTTYHSQTVYTSLSDLVGQLSSTTDPHTQAIVLVGNYHYNQNVVGTCFNTGKGVTIMSIDADCNQEPDYGWYSYHTTDRTSIPSLRFDFVPNIGIGMAARTTGSNAYPTIGIWHSYGSFELTETCVSIMNECEMSKNYYTNADDGKGNNRWIANSGYFLQIVYTREANCEKYSYTQIGGNAYVEQFYPGPHVNNTHSIKQCPVVVTGGEIEECYMTGKGASSNAKATGSDIYFWCAGGRIHKYLSAFMVVPTNSAGVNVTAKVDHARIYRFFGGGTSPSARITGNIDITMNNSLVDFYCGGPEFGDMSSGKTVTTNAIGSTFGEYYGAGYGGTAITYVTKTDNTYTYSSDYTFNESFDNYTNDRLQYSSGKGYGACYDFDYILYSGGAGKGVGRIYVGYADFSLAQTGNVTNTLQYCTVLGNYYGAGCQGKVAGTVTSTLTDCTLMQSAYGGGYKASANTLSVYPTTQPTYSTYTKETGLFSDFGTVTPDIFTWQYKSSTGSDETNKILYTTTNMSTLGNVTGAISITVDGGTVGESVFGGGNESPSGDGTTVVIKSDARIYKNVYGGGNQGEVGGDTKVIVNGTVTTP